MKTKNLINALTKVVKPTKTIEGNIAFCVGLKKVVVIDQDGQAIGIPFIGPIEVCNTFIRYHGKYNIKNLVNFLRGE